MFIRIPRVFVGSTLLLIALAVPTEAQDRLCRDTGNGREAETPLDCFDRLVRTGVAAKAPTAERVRTEGQSQAVAGSTGTTRDFLSSFLGFLSFGDLGGNGESLVLDFNDWFLDPGEKHDLSLRGVFSRPEVFARIAAEVPEDARSELTTRLEDELDDFDDFEISLTWAPENGRFGRDADDYFGVGQRALAADLFDAAEDGEDSLSAAAADAQESLMASLAGFDIDSPVEQLADPRRQELEAKIQSAANATVEEYLALRGIDPFKLADLINNQPQIYAKVGYRERDELSGRSGWTVSFTWEKSLASFNQLLDHCEGDIGTECFKTYLDEEGQALERAPRFKLEIELETESSYALSLPEEEIDLQLPSTEGLNLSATYGRYLRITPGGIGATRVDLEGLYERVWSDDPERVKERGVATLTLVQQVTEKTAAIVSLVWANKPEYLGEVDEELSARVGLKLRVDPGE